MLWLLVLWSPLFSVIYMIYLALKVHFQLFLQQLTVSIRVKIMFFRFPSHQDSGYKLGSPIRWDHRCLERQKEGCVDMSLSHILSYRWTKVLLTQRLFLDQWTSDQICKYQERIQMIMRATACFPWPSVMSLPTISQQDTPPRDNFVIILGHHS